MSPALAQTNLGDQPDTKQTLAVIAVKFHADWCRSYKALGNAFEELYAKFDTQPVLFVVHDHAKEFDRVLSRHLATTLGLTKIWEEYGNMTVIIMLLDGKTRALIATLTKDQDLKQMGEALLGAVTIASKYYAKLQLAVGGAARRR